jgi:hypothetical protein
VGGAVLFVKIPASQKRNVFFLKERNCALFLTRIEFLYFKIRVFCSCPTNLNHFQNIHMPSRLVWKVDEHTESKKNKKTLMRKLPQHKLNNPKMIKWELKLMQSQSKTRLYFYIEICTTKDLKFKKSRLYSLRFIFSPSLFLIFENCGLLTSCAKKNNLCEINLKNIKSVN